MKNRQFALSLAALGAGMLLLAFASAPLYRMFCQVTGFGGTTQSSSHAPAHTLERMITVSFNADTDPSLPWEFKPKQESVKVHVGEKTLVHYSAWNKSDKPITGRAVYNVVPFSAGAYFVKIQCFCFTEQTLEAGQKVDMPVLFYIDPDIVKDHQVDDVKIITLSYTFFPVKTEAK